MAEGTPIFKGGDEMPNTDNERNYASMFKTLSIKSHIYTVGSDMDRIWYMDSIVSMNKFRITHTH